MIFSSTPTTIIVNGFQLLTLGLYQLQKNARKICSKSQRVNQDEIQPKYCYCGPACLFHCLLTLPKTEIQKALQKSKTKNETAFFFLENLQIFCFPLVSSLFKIQTQYIHTNIGLSKDLVAPNLYPKPTY